MIVPSLIPSLLSEAELICRAPERFGRIATPRGVELLDLLEALMAEEPWNWLAQDYLSAVLHQAEDFELREDHVTWHGAGGALPADKTSTTQFRSGTLFAGRPLDAPDIDAGSAEPCILYTSLPSAVMIAGGRTNDYERIKVFAVSAEPGNAPLLRILQNGALWSQSLRGFTVGRVPIDLESDWMRDIHYNQCLRETLYVVDSGLQTFAMKKLYLLRSQEELEKVLVPHLANPDPAVRCNVLSALGMPAYRVGFVPGEPLAPRASRLEGAVLLPDTVDAILALARIEKDRGVLSWVVCTLKSQSYEGRLKPLASKVAMVTRRSILPRVSEKSVIEDARELLGQLPTEN